jgi:SHS2 domain-containing protein
VTHQFVDHTGEVEILADAETEEAVFEEMLLAFAELVGRGGGGRPGRRRIDLAAADRPTLLVDWLNELVFLAEVDGFVPERVEELSVGEGALSATVAGRLDAAPANLVKAATLNRLAFERGKDGWWARLVLDV